MPIRLGKERITDGIEIARIARGISADELEREPSLFSIINTNSPLKLDVPMLQGIIEMSARNQIICVTPFTLAGAMAPVTLAGALVEQNAEALAGLVMTQVVRKGAPFIYGGFTSNVDMKSGAPAFGTPEYMKAAIIGGQLARRYGLPYRTSNTCAANAVDAQSAYESVFSLWGAVMGGGNIVLHGAGWMEGGLVASFEKFVLDCDLIQMIEAFLAPLAVDSEALGLDAIREVGPGGHFFGAAHTLARYEHAFYAPLISDWRNFQQWVAAGRPEAHQKANQLYRQALAQYEAAADRQGGRRGARSLRQQAQGGGRRADGFLARSAAILADVALAGALERRALFELRHIRLKRGRGSIMPNIMPQRRPEPITTSAAVNRSPITIGAGLQAALDDVQHLRQRPPADRPCRRFAGARIVLVGHRRLEHARAEEQPFEIDAALRLADRNVEAGLGKLVGEIGADRRDLGHHHALVA